MCRGVTRSDLCFKKEHFGSCVEKRLKEINMRERPTSKEAIVIVQRGADDGLEQVANGEKSADSRCILEAKSVGVADGIHTK